MTNFVALRYALMCMWVYSFTCTCVGEIIHLSVRNDSRDRIPIGAFGFTSRGRLDLQVSHASWTGKSDTDLMSMGFLLITDDDLTLAMFQIQKDPTVECILQTSFMEDHVTFGDFNGSSEYKANVSVSKPNLLSFIFANCDPNVQVSFDLEAAFYNLEGKGASKDYLSDGRAQLPAIFFSFSAIHLVLFVVWIYVCVRQKHTAHRIHILMGVLVCFKALYLFSEGSDQAYIKHTGVVNGWEIAMYIFGFLKGVMLFTVIILIGTGWSILKPHLQGNEKWVLMIVIPLQVLANLVEVLIGESGPFFQDWLAWDRLMFLIDVICCCAVLFPIVWSIKRLRHAAQTDGKAASNLVKLTLFQQYYIVVVCYIYFTRVVVIMLAHVTPYHYTWVSVLASEMATLAFYVFTGYTFRPAPFNPYFMLDDDEEHVVEEDLKDDDFEL
eukprot:c23406_g1_i1 orf=198-1514(+)